MLEPYYSILFDTTDPQAAQHDRTAADALSDIHMDAIIQQILNGKEEYELETHFYTTLSDANAIHYRIEIMKDIDRAELLEPLNTFSRGMRRVRELAKYSRTFNDRQQQRKWLLDAAYEYCHGLLQLQKSLDAAAFNSLGLKRFTKWLTSYIETESFAALSKDTFELRKAFDHINYSIVVEDGKITVNPADNERDYCKSLSRALQLETDRENEDYSVRLFGGVRLSGLETNILNIVKKDYPEPFQNLKAYYSKHVDFILPSIMTFDREVQFYVACLEFFRPLKRLGHSYCYPKIIDKKEIHIQAGYDLSLASAARHSDQRVVCNDFDLYSNERICVVTGPNQGGKTTFARALGQILYLSAIGCPVPGETAEVYCFDQLFTHFPTKENPGRDTGQLKDELLRLNEIFRQVTSDSVVILNELFATTTTFDAYAMGTKTLQKFLRKGALCIYVTHLYELADVHEQTVSLVAATDPKAPSKRTYQIKRKAADGNVYASSLVEKYDLSRSRMKERIQA